MGPNHLDARPSLVYITLGVDQEVISNVRPSLTARIDNMPVPHRPDSIIVASCMMDYDMRDSSPIPQNAGMIRLTKHGRTFSRHP